MARAPRSKPTAETKSSLLQALEFCAVVAEKIGAPYETHVGISNNWAISFNGIVAAGAPIVEDIICYPHTLLLVEALSKCTEGFSLTQLDNGRLSIKSGKYKAVVPCLDPALMQSALPDPMIAPITNAFREAVEAVGVLASEGAQHVLTASVLMNGPSVISTNRVMLMEAWHGLDLPPNVPLPKQFVAALVKQKKDLVGFGFSRSSATVFYDDNSWLKTQLYSDSWPDLNHVLNIDCNLWPVPNELWKAIDCIEEFSIDGHIYSKDGMLCSHSDEKEGANYECKGVPPNLIFTISQLKLLKPWVKRIDFTAHGPNNLKCIAAYGDIARCIIAGRTDG